METKTDIEEARDWEGRLLDCAGCERLAERDHGRCRLGHACAHDRYARRIDRFFRWNPQLAKEYLGHAYFETRAAAAKYVEVFQLPRLIADSDETVRQSVAQRLPVRSRHLKALSRDPHREVRIRVAERLELGDLVAMIGDSDYYVRQIVARRLSPGLLVRMLHDADPEVRKVVARRVGSEWLHTMARDQDLGVRLEAVRRMDEGQLERYREDPDWRVRYEVASRLDPAELDPMRDDPDAAVRELVGQRLDGRHNVGVLPEAC
ncbi:4Fe4S-binding leucine-rich repeat protein [Methylocaldum sp.]|uniref:4Fe4S-binding leucine-rich repeat protein n=1 Tax=Methylocaldum sp. TaxID=1969727 RepID=UPI002D319089|nr:4Fe4S-binding leucine-rich repeat protein [Methylocaldum sp.]HYE37565.1 4Fe4S-binding leucine-rich repeat protein [Methylocaldum sp.]